MTALDRRDFLRLSAFGGSAWPSPSTRSRWRGAGLRSGSSSSARASPACAPRGCSQEAGHDVVILEAQRRPGGRVLTLREPFSDGLYAEAGAGRIPETHNLTLHYVKLFGLELEPFYPPPSAASRSSTSAGSASRTRSSRTST